MLMRDFSGVTGVKETGYGTEGGIHGIKEYLVWKSILINVAN